MSLLQRDPKSPIAWEGDLPVTNRYTFGIAGEKFFRAIKDEGRLLGTYCPHCDHTYVPATIFCERCLSKLEDWQDVGTTGIVDTFTFLQINLDGSPKEKPDIIAFIRIADGGLIHYLGDVEPEAVEVGMIVEAVFKPATERIGSILDISYFMPK